MLIFEKQVDSFKELLSCSDRVTIIPHKDPDGDAIGSSLAWLNVLRTNGFDVYVISPNAIPSNLMWMKGYEFVYVFEEENSLASEIIDKTDLLLFLDFNSISRVGSLLDILNNSVIPKVVIDHHPYPEDGIGNILFSEVSVSSTSELCYNIIENMGYDIDVDVAESLYAGIITDTGCLSYGSSHQEVYNIVGSLIAKGINKEKIHREIYKNKNLSNLQLLGHSLYNRLELLQGLPVAFIYLSRKDLFRFDYQPGDTEDLVNYPLTIKGITISAFFSERKKDFIKVSFRSEGDIAINEFAKRYFNGGGHQNAAGGEMYGTMEHVTGMFKIWIKEFFDD